VKLRPLIEVEDVTLQEAGDQALEAVLTNDNPPNLFARSGTPVRLMRDPREDEPQIRELSVDDTRVEVAQAADFVRSTDKKQKLVFPPRDVITYVRSHRGLMDLPSLVGITRCPVVRPDGSILVEEGYDASTGLWYAPAGGIELPRIPEKPAPETIADAIRLLWSWVGEFPYDGKASAANALALPLTLILRPAIEGHIPLLLIDKPTPGTGATLFVESVSLATLGKAAGAVGAPADDDAEMRKLLTGALRQSKQLIFFDNVPSNTTLKHGSLARALTLDTWEDRLLGHSIVVRLPQRATWCATGNNVQVSTEIARRCYKCRLDAKVEKPWEGREFSHPNLPAWTVEKRGAILSALLIIARNWFAVGKPEAQTPIIGMFEPWSSTLGGVLEAAGIHGFLGNLNELYEQSADLGGAWYAFLSAMHDLYGSTPRTTKEIAGDLNNAENSDTDDLRASLPDDFGVIDPTRPDTRLSRRLGNSFKARQGSRFGAEGLYLKQGPKQKGAVGWVVVAPEPGGLRKTTSTLTLCEKNRMRAGRPPRRLWVSLENARLTAQLGLPMLITRRW
jgi:hypothetical protein